MTVFAAASLKNALDETAKDYTNTNGGAVAAGPAASSALAKQLSKVRQPMSSSAPIRNGWIMSEGKGLIADGTRVNLFGNRLVLVAPAASTLTLEIEPGFKLAEALSGGSSLGNVKAVPAGKYAKAALDSLGVWPSVEGSLAPAENVRAALALVAQGETPLGIVYATDAAAEPKVKVVGVFPDNSHPPIVYPAAVMKGAAPAEASKNLLGFLRSEKAREIFKKQGFTILP